MSNAPSVLFGLVPLIRATVNSAATGALTTTVTADDSGTMFVSWTTGTHVYTLPAVADGKGKCWLFYQAESTTTVKIYCSTACIVGGDTTNTYATSASYMGDCAMIVGDGTYYYMISLAGTWTVASS
ncbi:MAG: hypothetical protein MUP81_00705 [Dehalococcoidia bacterium]|nr:hypothetical protein [Dehalococcoidia bacterium]